MAPLASTSTTSLPCAFPFWWVTSFPPRLACVELILDLAAQVAGSLTRFPVEICRSTRSITSPNPGGSSLPEASVSMR